MELVGFFASPDVVPLKQNKALAELTAIIVWISQTPLIYYTLFPSQYPVMKKFSRQSRMCLNGTRTLTIVSPDALAPNSTRPSANVVLDTKIIMFLAIDDVFADEIWRLSIYWWLLRVGREL